MLDGQQESIKEAFDTYANNDEDGRISVKRARIALRTVLDIDIRKEEIRHVCDDDDNLTWSTFSRFAASKLRQNAKAETAFALFDKDGKGLVCLDDVARVASELGETFTADELEEMVHEADPSGEGLIDQKGFFRIVRTLNL